MKFRIPDGGLVEIKRDGRADKEYPYRHRFRVRLDLDIQDPGGFYTSNVKETLTVIEQRGALNDVLAAAADRAAKIYEEVTGTDEGHPWEVLAMELRQAPYGDGEANKYRVSGVLRLGPWTLHGPVEPYFSLQEIFDACLLGYIGDSVDVYRNDDDEPTWRVTVGPRDGMQVEKW